MLRTEQLTRACEAKPSPALRAKANLMAPTDLTAIHAPYPKALDLELKLIADGCHIDIKPGAADDWASGTYRDPSGQRSPRITQDDGALTIDHARTATNLAGDLIAGTPRLSTPRRCTGR